MVVEVRFMVTWSGILIGKRHEGDKKHSGVFEVICFEIAQIFPQFVVSVENETILLSSREFILSGEEDITPDSALLTKVFSYRNENIIKLKSLNQDELLELAGKFKGKRYYAFKQREAIIYLLEEGNE